jgi:glutamate-ammonia-ligase adenylyltransferase
MKAFLNTTEHYQSLKKLLASKEDLEQKLDELRRYKLLQTKEIQRQLLGAKQDLKLTMKALTQLADAFLRLTFNLARNELKPIWGVPRSKDIEGNSPKSEFAIIGMGKLGGNELHFGSDLDLIFVFSSHGETDGPKSITNQEYFSKLAQRIINYLILPTTFGFVYKIDTELRPSGNAGTLVTPIEAWISYYHEFAAIWERQALLKARMIYASENFEKAFEGLFPRLIFNKPFPPTLAAEIHYLRTRIEKELAKETDQCWHYKKGYGGLVDIEFAVQYLQLKLGKEFPQIITPNTLDALDQLEQKKLISNESVLLLRQAYYFYRWLEIYLEVQFELKDGYLDIEHECIADLAKIMSYAGPKEFLAAFANYRRQVRINYCNILHIEEI